MTLDQLQRIAALNAEIRELKEKIEQARGQLHEATVQCDHKRADGSDAVEPMPFVEDGAYLNCRICGGWFSPEDLRDSR